LNLVSSPTVAAAYAAHWRERLAASVRFDRRGRFVLELKLTSRLARLFWEALDRADYAVALARCWAVDRIYGPEPLIPADLKREAPNTTY
jgi:hypothetical protein